MHYPITFWRLFPILQLPLKIVDAFVFSCVSSFSYLSSASRWNFLYLTVIRVWKCSKLLVKVVPTKMSLILFLQHYLSLWYTDFLKSWSWSTQFLIKYISSNFLQFHINFEMLKSQLILSTQHWLRIFLFHLCWHILLRTSVVFNIEQTNKRIDNTGRLSWVFSVQIHSFIPSHTFKNFLVKLFVNNKFLNS